MSRKATLDYITVRGDKVVYFLIRAYQCGARTQINILENILFILNLSIIKSSEAYTIVLASLYNQKWGNFQLIY